MLDDDDYDYDGNPEGLWLKLVFDLNTVDVSKTKST